MRPLLLLEYDANTAGMKQQLSLPFFFFSQYPFVISSDLINQDIMNLSNFTVISTTRPLVH